MKLAGTYQKASSLTNVPEAVHKLIDRTNNDNVAIDEVADIIAANQVLHTILPRVKKPAHNQVYRAFEGIKYLLAMLGLVTVQTLLRSALTCRFESMTRMALPKFWFYRLYHLKLICSTKCLVKHWTYSKAFHQAIPHFTEPLPSASLDRIARLTPVAVWPVRDHEHHLIEKQIGTTRPSNVAATRKLIHKAVMNDMPTIKNLTAGMESLAG